MWRSLGEEGLARPRIRPNVMRKPDIPKPGGSVELFPLGVLAVVWVVSSSGTGFLLALLARRIHPGLSLVRLWFFYTILMALLVAFVFVLGWF